MDYDEYKMKVKEEEVDDLILKTSEMYDEIDDHVEKELCKYFYDEIRGKQNDREKKEK